MSTGVRAWVSYGGLRLQEATLGAALVRLSVECAPAWLGMYRHPLVIGCLPSTPVVVLDTLTTMPARAEVCICHWLPPVWWGGVALCHPTPPLIV